MKNSTCIPPPYLIFVKQNAQKTAKDTVQQSFTQLQLLFACAFV